MSQSTSSLPESLSVDHLTAWELREHLIALTVQFADELMAQADHDRLGALAELYRSTLSAWNRRQGRRS
jgi:hypothetical protein